MQFQSSWYLAPVHFNHLESPHSLHFVFNLLPELLHKVFWRNMCWFGNRSRKPFTPWSRLISIYINIVYDDGKIINGLQGICCNSLAILLHIIHTKAFGHRQGRDKGAPRSLQPLLQGGTQLWMMLWDDRKTLITGGAVQTGVMVINSGVCIKTATTPSGDII